MSSSVSSAYLRPIRRLAEKMVLRGLVTACRLAACPTMRSPFFVNATMDGVVRAPSLFSSTVACPPSITAMQEFVVPRSIPRILLIVSILSVCVVLTFPSTNLRQRPTDLRRRRELILPSLLQMACQFLFLMEAEKAKDYIYRS